MKFSTLGSIRYRISTIFEAVKFLRKLTPEQVDEFIKSAEIYDCDWVNNQAMKGDRPIAYAEVKQNILTWYNVLNYLCAIGEVEKMYMPPCMDASKNILKNQNMLEEHFARMLKIKAGDKVLELGCGRGRIAAHIATYTGADVTGINIDQVQLNNAISFAKKYHLDHCCHFINGDFNELPLNFPANHFDYVYAIQPLSVCRNLEKLFKDLHRILKPGGKVYVMEWVCFPKYDPHNMEHAALMKQIKPLVGAIGNPSPEVFETSFRNAGFQVLLSKDASMPGFPAVMTKKAASFFNASRPFIRFLITIRVLPTCFWSLIEQFQKGTEALCEAERQELISFSYQLLAQK